MFEVSAAAQKQVADYFRGKDIVPIRVFLNQGGWAGPSLALALDESKKTDVSYEIDGFTYVVEKTLIEEAKPIKIDFTGMGFKITSSLRLGGEGCSGCGSGSSCSV